MGAQTSDIQRILEDNGLCDFSLCTTSRGLASLLNEPDVMQYLGTSVGQLISNLTILAAVEFGLVRISYGPQGLRVPLPVVIERQDVWLSITKYDTTDTKPCKTGERIINGQIFAYDLFLFGGDWQKYETVVSPGASLEQGLDQLATKLTSALHPKIHTLAEYLTSGMWWEFQQLVWRLRLLVMREAHTSVSKESEMIDAVVNFRNNWPPPPRRSGGGFTPPRGGGFTPFRGTPSTPTRQVV